MMKYIQIPRDDRFFDLDPSTFKIALYITSRCYFELPEKLSAEKINIFIDIPYHPTKWARELKMSKGTMINAIKKLIESGYLFRNYEMNMIGVCENHE